MSVNYLALDGTSAPLVQRGSVLINKKSVYALMYGIATYSIVYEFYGYIVTQSHSNVDLYSAFPLLPFSLTIQFSSINTHPHSFFHSHHIISTYTPQWIEINFDFWRYFSSVCSLILVFPSYLCSTFWNFNCYQAIQMQHLPWNSMWTGHNMWMSV